MNVRKLASLLAAAATVAVSGQAKAETDPILVGQVIALSGWMEPYDYAARTANFAIEDINAAGGLLGRQIKTEVFDTKTDTAEGARAGAQVAADGADLVIVSCDYDQGAPAALAAVSAGKLAISLCAGDPKMGVQGIGRLAFTAAPAGQTQGASSALWAHDKMGAKTAYVLLDDAIEYTKSVCKGFEWQWSKFNDVEMLGSDTFKNGDPSIASQISRIKALPKQPDVIALCSFIPGAASALRQIRAAGITQPIFMPTGSDGSYWVGAIPDLSNVFIPAPVLAQGGDPNPDVNKLIDRYKAKYGEAPATSYVLFGYALVQTWAKAVEKAGSPDPEAVASAMETFENVPTILGPVSFSPDLHIQNKARYLMLQIDKGAYKQLGYLDSPQVPSDVLFAP